MFCRDCALRDDRICQSCGEYVCPKCDAAEEMFDGACQKCRSIHCHYR
jgi:hypothetical protein